MFRYLGAWSPARAAYFWTILAIRRWFFANSPNVVRVTLTLDQRVYGQTTRHAFFQQ